jgi:hypothetical protein
MPYVKDLFLRTAAGERVRFPQNNVTKCGNILAAAPDRETAMAAAEEAARAVLIRLEAPDSETGAFLDIQDGDTADAFPLDEALRSLLTGLPAPEAEFPRAAGSRLAILPFPEFLGSGCVDYMGRTPAESLTAVRELTGLALPLREPSPEEQGGALVLGRTFWAALIRGGYQGAAYMVDRFLQSGTES